MLVPLAPPPGMVNRGGEVVETRPPTQLGGCFISSSHQHRRITGAAGGLIDLQLQAGKTASRADHIRHGMVTAGAEVVVMQTAMPLHLLEDKHMGIGQIADVDAITDAGAIRCWVVGSVDANGGSWQAGRKPGESLPAAARSSIC